GRGGDPHVLRATVARAMARAADGARVDDGPRVGDPVPDHRRGGAVRVLACSRASAHAVCPQGTTRGALARAGRAQSLQSPRLSRVDGASTDVTAGASCPHSPDFETSATTLRSRALDPHDLQTIRTTYKSVGA